MKDIRSAITALGMIIGCLAMCAAQLSCTREVDSPKVKGQLSAGANSVTYDLAFSGGSPAPTSGSFTYDTAAGRFTSFKVLWNGATIDLLPSANSPVTQTQATETQVNRPSFTGPMIYELLVHGGKYNGLDINKTWAVYPPNPPGNMFTSAFALHLLTARNEGTGVGGEYPDPSFVARETSGTFTVVPRAR